MDGTCGATYLLQSCEQGWSDGGHVVGVKRHPGAAHFLCKHSSLFELGHKGTDCFLKIKRGTCSNIWDHSCTAGHSFHSLKHTELSLIWTDGTMSSLCLAINK